MKLIAKLALGVSMILAVNLGMAADTCPNQMNTLQGAIANVFLYTGPSSSLVTQVPDGTAGVVDKLVCTGIVQSLNTVSNACTADSEKAAAVKKESSNSKLPISKTCQAGLLAFGQYAAGLANASNASVSDVINTLMTNVPEDKNFRTACGC